MKKIKLLEDIPVEAVHGLTQGRVMVVEKTSPYKSPRTGIEKGVEPWVKGDDGELVKVMRGEFEVVE